MYLWVVLATFLAMIAAYALPIRQDTQEAVTMVEATITSSRMRFTMTPRDLASSSCRE